MDSVPNPANLSIFEDQGGGSSLSRMDMLTSVLAYGAPELSLQSAALTEMAHFLGLPVWSTAGCTDSREVDEQAGLEGAVSILFAGLSGADLVHDVGYTESALTGALQMTTMSDEIISYVKRLLLGIEVTPETLATGVVREVGPGGHFLATDHTLNHYRQEFWFPRLMDRNRWEDWQTDGSRTMGDRVQAALGEILDTQQPVPLARDVQVQVEEILAKAEQRYTVATDNG